ncbi:signal transduction histidine kinase [Crossiella equi]|uniref:histidine kinase n=1 Tax=Crossiella equi TaxID=130796 RepID=A0ABS5AL13_9PSEU|nr:histidine kinase [Crossiella equi]MBP2477251.1 signal transduction histidine kinase [Crossiella equi]
MSWNPRLGPRTLLVLDGLAALAVVTAAGLRGTVGPGAASALPPVWIWALAALVGLPLAVRRRWPIAVLAVVLGVGAAGIAVGVSADVLVFAVAYALYTGCVQASARVAGGVLALVIGAFSAAGVVAVLTGPPGVPGVESFGSTPGSSFVYGWVVLSGAWALARVVHGRRAHAAVVTALREERAVVAERLRIARDIHDVVGHNLSLIALRASVAIHLADRQPGQERVALAEIEEISRRALADVRSVLGSLRDPGDAVPEAVDLARLVQDARVAGLEVEVVGDGLDGVPAAVRVSVQRIVQEALTNVLRHAGAARCRVSVEVAGGEVVVEVADDGGGSGPGGQGFGLVGMRERAALHGGSVAAGPRLGGGFQVRARLPFGEAAGG